MANHEPLHGACLCGRNQYLIHIPDNVTEHAEIYFDSGRDNRTSPLLPMIQDIPSPTY